VLDFYRSQVSEKDSRDGIHEMMARPASAFSWTDVVTGFTTRSPSRPVEMNSVRSTRACVLCRDGCPRLWYPSRLTARSRSCCRRG